MNSNQTPSTSTNNLSKLTSEMIPISSFFGRWEGSSEILTFFLNNDFTYEFRSERLFYTGSFLGDEKGLVTIAFLCFEGNIYKLQNINSHNEFFHNDVLFVKTGGWQVTGELPSIFHMRRIS